MISIPSRRLDRLWGVYCSAPVWGPKYGGCSKATGSGNLVNLTHRFHDLLHFKCDLCHHTTAPALLGPETTKINSFGNGKRGRFSSNESLLLGLGLGGFDLGGGRCGGGGTLGGDGGLWCLCLGGGGGLGSGRGGQELVELGLGLGQRICLLQELLLAIGNLQRGGCASDSAYRVCLPQRANLGRV